MEKVKDFLNVHAFSIEVLSCQMHKVVISTSSFVE